MLKKAKGIHAIRKEDNYNMTYEELYNKSQQSEEWF